MTLPWPLNRENTEALQEASAPLAPEAPEAPGTSGPPDDPDPAPSAPRWRGVLRRAATSGPGRRVRSGTSAVLRRVMAEDLQLAQHLAGDIHDLRSQLARLDQAPDWYAEASRSAANLELLKAEVRALERSLLELGMQLAPATGLAGVGVRFGELREQVNAASRRLQQLDKSVRVLEGNGTAQPTPAPAAGSAAPDAPATASGGGLDDYFDYVAFEQRFRGDAQEILAIQQERYESLLTDHSPVLDWGCGRGELLELLASKDVPVVGVEIDAGMVAEARARGLTIHQQDAVSYLRTCEPESLGAVFSAHVAEHIPFDALLEVIHASLRALRPGGIFVAETPNPASLIVPSNSFILDPTHLRPIHPSLFAFACETAGFRDVRLHLHSPATGYHLGQLEDDGSPEIAILNANVNRLNDVLFGPQEYAVIATKAPTPTSGTDAPTSTETTTTQES